MSQAQGKRDGHLAMVGCGVALLALVPVAAKQLGMIDHLPDPPLPIFDTDGLVTAKDSYPLGIPDSLPGLASFSVTMALLIAARRRAPIASRLLGWKLKADASLAAGNTVRGVVKHGKLCAWCLVTALGTALMVTAGERFLAE